MPAAGPSELVETFSGLRLVVLGDVMLDRFLWGSVSRISPEAPVPVVEVERESFFPGGAANVARNLVSLGGRVDLFGLIGEDAYSGLLLETLAAGDIRTDHLIRSAAYTTITKTRVVARQQQVVRIDRERRRPLTPEEEGRIAAHLEEVVGEIDGIIVEDYGKGLVTASLVEKVAELAKGAGKIVTADPNPNNPLPWRNFTAVKPNRLEAFKEVGRLDEGDHPEPLEDTALLEVGAELLDRWASQHVLVTLGEQGMMLFSQDSDPFHVPTRAKEVFDVSGAGDTAIAVFTLALCAGASARDAADLSNRASGIVVGKLGTASVSGEDLLADLD